MDAKHGCRHHAVRASSSSWVSLKEEDVVALAPDGGRLFFTLGPLRTEPGLQIALARTATATAPNVAPDDSAPIVPHNLLFALIADAIPAHTWGQPEVDLDHSSVRCLRKPRAVRSVGRLTRPLRSRRREALALGKQP